MASVDWVKEVYLKKCVRSLSLSLSNKTIDFLKESYPEQGFLNNIADFLKESYPEQGFLIKIIDFLKESDPEQGVKGV